MKIYIISYLFLYLILTTESSFCGFASNTLVSTPQGLISIENIQINDTINSFNTESNTNSCNSVTAQFLYHCPKIIIITLEDDTQLITTPDQKFFIHDTRTWKKAKNLDPQEHLYCKNNHYISIKKCNTIKQKVKIFDITVSTTHTFYVSHHQILVHNFIPIAIGLSWTFGSGIIEFAGAMALLGSLFGITLFKNKMNSNTSSSNYSITFAGSPPPDDD